jgi:hypothetical protein
MTPNNLRPLMRITATVISVAALATAGTRGARADDSAAILKAMTDYTAAQKAITATFDSDIEVLTPDLQKIQFDSSGRFQLSRPDKLRIRHTGGYADVELVFDGKTVSLYGNNAKAYVQADAAGTIDQLIDTLQSKAGAAMPGADLLLTNSFDQLIQTWSTVRTSARASSMASSASTLRFAATTRIGKSGSRAAPTRSRANT